MSAGAAMLPVTRVCAAVLLAALAACASRGPAPVVERGTTRTPAPRPPVAQQTPVPGADAGRRAGEASYTVRRGDTLYSIALEHGADYRELAQWNSLDDPSKIRVGQVLRVKPPEERGAQVGGARIAGRVESRPLEPGPASAEPKPPVQAEAKPESEAKSIARQEAERIQPAPPVAAAAAAAAEFIWPAKGKVLAGFAEPRSKGIDIDGRPGDPVVAAASGRVTYTGTGIPGLGKLVVIKHDNGFITVYAHNREILVKEQQTVARGQRIAELGSTDSDRPKLHFQIRKGSSPVDPLRYLPAS